MRTDKGMEGSGCLRLSALCFGSSLPCASHEFSPRGAGRDEDKRSVIHPTGRDAGYSEASLTYHIERSTGLGSFAAIAILTTSQTPTTFPLAPSHFSGPQCFLRVRRVK